MLLLILPLNQSSSVIWLHILNIFLSPVTILVCVQVVRAKERLDEELIIQSEPQQQQQKQQNTETWSMKWCLPFLSSPRPL